MSIQSNIEGLTKDYKIIEKDFRDGKINKEEYDKRLEDVIRESNRVRKECKHIKIYDKKNHWKCEICGDDGIGYIKPGHHDNKIWNI